MNNPDFSIISVCFNCQSKIERTVQSLLNQTYDNYEYIVIDGNSTDNTLVEVRKNTKSVKNLTIISEPDQGIYDAMNKGVKYAKGSYIFFLNMGDEFYNSDVLRRISKELLNGADFYYGNICKDDGLVILQKGRATIWCALYREYMICHQSIFASRQTLVDIPFDLTYKVCADRNWLIHILRNGKKGFYVDCIICKFETDGVSSNYSEFKNESLDISKKYGGILAVAIVKVKRILGKLSHRA